MIVDQEEPVTAPGDVAGYATEPIDIHGDLPGMPETGYVVQSDLAGFVQQRLDSAHRGLDGVLSRADSSKVCERRKQANRAMAAHSEIGGLVKKDDPGRTGRIDRLAEQRTDHCVRASRLVHNSSTQPIVFRPQQVQSLSQRSAAKLWAAFYNHACRLAPGM